ncbi:MAG: phytanoyl-CoA dioxygenase family protein [Planctomycetes bacterium]|nr:phytanoyl-CoA dioxygenase family protein [Planctomycetota bacterium]
MSMALAHAAQQASTDARREELLDAGCCVFKNVLDRAMLDELRLVTDGLLDAVPQQDREYFRYQGSNIFVAYQHEVFARLIAWPQALAALRALGFARPKWLSSFLLSKPPQAPALYWHQDWWLWDDACSAAAAPPQVFLMYYLTATTRENGCLRVLPGSHRKRIALHDQLPVAHGEAAYKAAPDSPAFCDHPDARDLCVAAGDLVVGDARVLHAAHPNRTAQRRTCLTLWYAPDFEALSEPAQAAMARKQPAELPLWWPGAAGNQVKPLIPFYTGAAQPGKFNRVPDVHLAR